MSASETPFSDISDQDPFCQGDVLHAVGAENEGIGKFGVVITADCDIAQDKAGGVLSLLTMQSVESYIRDAWAPLETRKILAKRTSSVLSTINSAISKLDQGLQPLSESALLDWLQDRAPEEILDAIEIRSKSARADALRDLGCILDSIVPARRCNIDVLSKIWNRMDTSQKQIESRLRDAIDPVRGPSDIYFIPYLPTFKNVGFVIYLRSIFSVPSSRVFPTRAHARIADCPNGYCRVGRFRDAVKYSIVQRMSHLFSRIGFSEEYEDEAAIAADLTIDSMLGRFQGETV